VGATNQTYLGFATATGGFTVSTPVTHPESPAEGWANYETLVADVNGDGKDDLVWNYRGALSGGQNRTYLGLSIGDGTFGFPSVRIHPNTFWPGYHVLAGDLDGDGDADLVWNRLSSTENRSHAGLSDGAANFTFTPFQDRLGNWTPYRAFLGDVDGDTDTDLIWNALGAGNTSYCGRSNGNGTWTFAGPFSNTGVASWTGFVPLVGDVDGDLHADVIWADTATAQSRVAVGRSTGSALTFPAVQQGQYSAGVPLRALAGDVNGDGKADLVWNTTGSVNRVYVALGKADATFAFSPLDQLHPATGVPWEQFALFVVDVNGDGRADAVWNHPAVSNQLYVALAKP